MRKVNPSNWARPKNAKHGKTVETKLKNKTNRQNKIDEIKHLNFDIKISDVLVKNFFDINKNPISGSIKEQAVTFIGKEKIELYGKTLEVEHFKLTSKDMSIPKDKRLNFDIWFDKKHALIMKVTYSRMGNWEYRVKNFE